MKIRSVSINRRKKCIEIESEISKRKLGLPFSKLRLKPTAYNRIAEIYVDPELGRQGITYRLDSGKEDSLHIDAFLDYNKDPNFLRNVTLHKLSIEASKAFKRSDLSKHEVVRRLQTSPSQLYRLLDPANYKKSIDEVLKLLSVLGCEVSWYVNQEEAA